MILGANNKRPQIEYPCDWDYKIIGSNVENIIDAVRKTVDGLKYEIRPSNVSNTGKYFSINLKVRVINEEERNFIFETLSNNNDIIMVI